MAAGPSLSFIRPLDVTNGAGVDAADAIGGVDVADTAGCGRTGGGRGSLLDAEDVGVELMDTESSVLDGGDGLGLMARPWPWDAKTAAAMAKARAGSTAWIRRWWARIRRRHRAAGSDPPSPCGRASGDDIPVDGLSAPVDGLGRLVHMLFLFFF